ncbi:MAG TPA: YqiA/YcfP family alpha/beta fold hydrolase [Kofleriaceae bacterium]|nr:YqiA/YcfP family alpha/beta fold hydrolase [Kofleriaceae bacterium]
MRDAGPGGRVKGYVPAVRLLYLHGFASGPGSKKGVAFAEHFAARGIDVARLNLRVPSFEHLRLSAMIDHVQAAIGEPRERAVIVGSSLGGLTAARVAERDARVGALILFAPAFQLVDRWRTVLADDFAAWQRTGWREVVDYTTGQSARVDFGFVEDARQVDIGFPDVRVPTLVIHGVHDDVVPIDHARRFAAGKRHVRVIEVDDGHELVASLPRLLAEADAFLAPWLGA